MSHGQDGARAKQTAVGTVSHQTERRSPVLSAEAM